MDLVEMWEMYGLGELFESQVAVDPVVQFQTWLEQARQVGLSEPNAMVLATADADGSLSAWIVLLKCVDERGFVFYINQQSWKGDDLVANPRCALVFLWYVMERQVCVEGIVTKLPTDEVDEYFASRLWGFQFGVWALQQSQSVAFCEELDLQYESYERQWLEGIEIFMLYFWGGYLVVLETVEFWQGCIGCLYDCFVYRCASSGEGWELFWFQF